MGPIGYRLRSWLRTRWRTAALLTAVVAVVGGVVLTLVAGASRTITAPDRYVTAQGDIYDVTIEQAFGVPRVADVGALRAVDVVDAATFVFGGLIPEGSEEPAFALVFAGSPVFLGGAVAEGRDPDPALPGEFVASASFLEATGARVGDTFTLISITQEQSDEFGFDVPEPAGPTLEATLVGMVEEGPADLEGGTPLAVFPTALLDAGDIGVAATVMAAGLTPGSTVDDLRDQLDALADGDAFSVSPHEWVPSEVREAVDAQAQGLIVLAAVVAGAAVVVVGQLLSRQFRPSEADRRVLSSVGFSRAQVAGDPVVRAAVVVGAGSVLAVAAAFAASGVFPLDFAARVEPEPGRRVDLLGHALGPVVLAGALLLWVLTSVAMEVRRELRSVGASSAIVERLVAAIPSAPAATGLRFAFTPASVGGRSRATPLLGLALVVGILVGALTFGANLGRLVDDEARWGRTFDVGIGAGGEEIPEDVWRQVEAHPDVAALMLYGATTVAVGSRRLGIVGMRQVRGDLAPDTLRGRLPQSDDEIALGAVAARALDVDVDDELTVAGAAGPQAMRVTGVAVIPGIEESDVIGDVGLVTYSGLLRIDPTERLSSAVIDLRAGAPADVAEQLSALTGMGVGPLDTPSEVVNLGRVRDVPFLVASIVGALAVLSLGHQMIVAVRRRRRDFAILRALGVAPRWLTSVVHWQATMITAVVLAIAIPTGIAAGNFLFRPYVDRLGARAGVSIPFAWLGLTLAGMLVVANLVAEIPARQTRRTPTTHLLAHE